jgi:hypothetical protein
MTIPLSSIGGNVEFLTSGFTAHIVHWRLGPFARRALATAHQQTAQPGISQIANATFRPGKLIGGTDLILVVQFDPNEIPPIKGPIEPIRITFPRPPTEPFSVRWQSDGFAQRLLVTKPLDVLVMAELTTRLTGTMAVTNTDAVSYYTEEFEWDGLENVTPYYTEEFEWGGLENVTTYYTEEFES